MAGNICECELARQFPKILRIALGKLSKILRAATGGDVI